MDKLKIIILVLCAVVVLFYLNAPSDFPSGTITNIPKGSSLREVSLQLSVGNIIRSRLVFEAFVILYGGERHMMYSDYFFENKLPVYEVARRITKGEHHIPQVKVTIPEGFDAVQIADTLALKLINFNKEDFLMKAKGLEGNLFPDTYFFFRTATAVDVIQVMNENFEKKMEALYPEIVSSGKTEKEIVIMASIVEGEAKGDADRGFISGILWRRIAVGMPLQADVAPETYQKKGLPQSAVGNPGLAALKASIHPQSSPYLYYLHDKDGNIHYAKTFAEHQTNIKKYLSR